MGYGLLGSGKDDVGGRFYLFLARYKGGNLCMCFLGIL